MEPRVSVVLCKLRGLVACLCLAEEALRRVSSQRDVLLIWLPCALVCRGNEPCGSCVGLLCCSSQVFQETAVQHALSVSF